MAISSGVAPAGRRFDPFHIRRVDGRRFDEPPCSARVSVGDELEVELPHASSAPGP